MSAVELVEIECSGGMTTAVYSVSTRHGLVYMSAHLGGYDLEHRFVLIADTGRLEAVWTPQHPDSGSNIHEDRKYLNAVTGFSHGIGNPVPLAEVDFASAGSTPLQTPWWKPWSICCRSTLQPTVSFIDGITRTSWLINNGATSIPLETNRAEVNSLYRLIGSTGIAPVSIAQLKQAASLTPRVSRYP